ncbi:hypothetical protein QA584_26360 [Anaerocolumna sp. AGMB13025]|uniref:hypothetical protein n=1 Tax=Anaerocolumna sp. AGMB13025 TaxID=3039116 RepID=UPI00241CC771|nr:hypothetical protein [Anaerocolumna sp. AGMB13025]WFR57095.1 hypothetical protein QA584_26360 [Anaerocolumna sp. AGMB13025]
MEDEKMLEAPLIILRYMGSGMYERCGSGLGRPYLPPCGKEDAYKQSEIVFLEEGVYEEIIYGE